AVDRHPLAPPLKRARARRTTHARFDCCKSYNNTNHKYRTPGPNEPNRCTGELRMNLVRITSFCQTVGGVLLIAFAGCAPPPAPPVIPAAVAPVRRATVKSDSLPSVKFVDITNESGISFVHYNGALGSKLLPETMGAGVAFLDYDRDGDQDLFFVNSSYWPQHEIKPAPTQALYRNDGKGHFEDVTKVAGLDKTFYGQGVA